MRRALALIAILLAASAAQAQTIYRSVMPDGGIVYGDKPVAGARDAREVELPPPNLAIPEPASPRANTGAPAPYPPKATNLDDAVAVVKRASDELDRARAALAAGREPLPGETEGTAIAGRTRHTDGYERRQRALADAVTAAQKRLDAALDRRNALR